MFTTGPCYNFLRVSKSTICKHSTLIAYIIGRTRGKYNRLANYRLFTIDGDKYNSDWLTVKELHNVSLYQTLRSYSTLCSKTTKIACFNKNSRRLFPLSPNYRQKPK